MSLPSFTISRHQLIFAINCFVAALLALYIAFSIGLPRPYWAMLTVYITAQPLTGALRSKALYRVLGTALGGCAAVIIVPTFVNAPSMMALAMAAWVGGCLYLSLLDRTPRAYVFMLAGYTAAIIGFPSVAAPQAIFETALARVEEITLGIVCATLVHTIVFPRDVGHVLTARIAGFLKDSQAWIVDALAPRPNGAAPRERRQLAADITELHIAATHLPFDTTHLPLRVDTVRALEARLSSMVPLISALEDRLAQLGRRGKALSRLLDDVMAWAGQDSDAHQAQRLRERCHAMTPVITARSHWKTLLTVSILVRLDELVQALQDSRALAEVASGAASDVDARLQALLREQPRRRLHLDHGMAALSGLALMVAMLACCTLWIATAWPEGAVAAMMAGVFSAFFAAQDDPAPALGTLLVWILLGIPVGAVYLFWVLPAIDGFPMLALALAPAMLAIGYFMPSPRWGLPAMAMLLGFAGGLALQANFSADLPEFLNTNLAQAVGIGAAIATTRLMRSVGAEWAARRIQRHGWRDIVALARSRSASDAHSWTGLMLDRVGLVAARAALAEPNAGHGAGADTGGAVADMRIGLNLIELDALTRRTSTAPASAIARTLEGVAQVFEQRLHQGADAPADPRLLHAIDDAITGLAQEGDPDPRQVGFAALVGLRRNLFPQAAPYRRAAA